MLKKILVKEVIAPIIIILFFFIIYTIIKRILKRIMGLKLSGIDNRRQKTITSLVLNVIKYFFIIIAILMIVSIYGVDTSAIITSIGAVGVVVGLSFQDIIKDFLSGISIIIENQYGIGDVVTIGGFKGEVIALGLRTTKIRAYTGEVNIIANRNIGEIINHSCKNSLAIVDVMVAYEEDLDKVEKVLNELFERLNREIKGLKGKITLLGVNSLDSSGITYRATVETEPMKHIEITRILLKEIKNEFDNKNITIPYNQLVIHNA